MIHIVRDSHAEITASLQVQLCRHCYLLCPATASVIPMTTNCLLMQHTAMSLCNPVLTKGFQPWTAFLLTDMPPKCVTLWCISKITVSHKFGNNKTSWTLMVTRNDGLLDLSLSTEIHHEVKCVDSPTSEQMATEPVIEGSHIWLRRHIRCVLSDTWCPRSHQQMWRQMCQEGTTEISH